MLQSVSLSGIKLRTTKQYHPTLRNTILSKHSLQFLPFVLSVLSTTSPSALSAPCESFILGTSALDTFRALCPSESFILDTFILGTSALDTFRALCPSESFILDTSVLDTSVLDTSTSGNLLSPQKTSSKNSCP